MGHLSLGRAGMRVCVFHDGVGPSVPAAFAMLCFLKAGCGRACTPAREVLEHTQARTHKQAHTGMHVHTCTDMPTQAYALAHARVRAA